MTSLYKRYYDPARKESGYRVVNPNGTITRVKSLAQARALVGEAPSRRGANFAAVQALVHRPWKLTRVCREGVMEYRVTKSGRELFRSRSWPATREYLALDN